MNDSEPLMPQESPKQPAIVDRIIPKGLVIVAGEAEVGKSYAMLNLVIACASLEGVLWEKFPVNHQIKSLYIDFESTPVEVQESVRQVVGDRIYNIKGITFQGVDQSTTFQLNPQGLAKLKTPLIKNSYELVVVDTFADAKQDVILPPEDAYQRAIRLLSPVSQLVKELSITTILVHHTNKTNDLDNPFNSISGSAERLGIKETTANSRMKRMKNRNLLDQVDGKGSPYILPREEIAF